MVGGRRGLRGPPTAPPRASRCCCCRRTPAGPPRRCWATGHLVADRGEGLGVRGDDASPSGKVTSTWTGPSAPGPSASEAADTPARISCDELNWRSKLLPNTIDIAGTAIASSTADAAAAEAHGRCITQPIQCVQNRDCVVSGRRDQCSAAERLAAERPNVVSTAGVMSSTSTWPPRPRESRRWPSTSAPEC